MSITPLLHQRSPSLSPPPPLPSPLSAIQVSRLSGREPRPQRGAVRDRIVGPGAGEGRGAVASLSFGLAHGGGRVVRRYGEADVDDEAPSGIASS